MITLLLITAYLVLEVLRPEVLMPGQDLQLQFWLAAAMVISCPAEMLMKGRGLQMGRASWWAIGLLITGLISGTVATVQGVGDYSKMLDLAKVIFISLALMQAVDRESRLRYIRVVIVVLPLLLSIGGVLFSLGLPVPGFKFEAKVGRLQYAGILSDANDLGLTYMVAWGILIYAAVNSNGFVKRTLALLLAIPAGWAIFLTVSRGAMLAATTGIFMAFRRRMGARAAGILAAVLLFGMVSLGVGRMGMLSSDESSADLRIRAWTQGWYMLRSNPVFGVGPQNFKEYTQYAAHSSLVQIGAELGMIGLFFWVAFFAMPLMGIPKEADENDSCIFIARQFHGTLVSCMVAAFFLSRAYIVTTYLMAGIVLCGVHIAADETVGETESDSLQLETRFRSVLALQLALLLFWRYSIRLYVQGI